jgi:hypothetical protein
MPHTCQRACPPAACLPASLLRPTRAPSRSSPSHPLLLVCRRRLLQRSETSGRVDDNAETITKRFAVFEAESMPVIHYMEASPAAALPARACACSTGPHLSLPALDCARACQQLSPQPRPPHHLPRPPPQHRCFRGRRPPPDPATLTLRPPLQKEGRVIDIPAAAPPDEVFALVSCWGQRPPPRPPPPPRARAALHAPTMCPMCVCVCVCDGSCPTASHAPASLGPAGGGGGGQADCSAAQGGV